ncbi:MAG: WxL domain-containing protein, partial [Kurthia sp.]|nr:WxL domain-containing protein [Candidatus Kurthia equi]
GKTLAIVKGDKLPNALDFLSHVKDSNPANFSITHVYFADYSKLPNQVGTHDVFMEINDTAKNIRKIPARLIVVDTAYGVSANDFVVNLSELKGNDTDEKLQTYLLSQAQAKAWGIDKKTLIDYTDKLSIADLTSIKQMKAGKYQLKTSFDQTAINPNAKGEKLFKVTVLNDEAVSPTDPENPGEGSPKEKENGGTGQTGLLKLDYAPTSFDFGTVKYGFDAVDRNAKKTLSDKQWLQVSDNREETKHTNWSVQVAQNHTLQSSDGKELKGATIQIPEGKKYNQNYTGKEIIGENGPLISNRVDISTEPSTIFQTDNQQGIMGDISTNVWNASDVKLHIPGNQILDYTDYTNTINWTLIAEP